MENEENNHPAAKAPVGRRTIWQISSSYHCSVIGTCLGRRDLRRLARKKIFAMGSDTSDYEVHRRLSGDSSERSGRTRSLTKYLDLKHQAAIKRYNKLQTETDLRRQWRQDIDSGDIAGAYWALLTHPEVGRTLAADLYGECHMLSFDAFSEARRHSEEMILLRQDVARLSTELTQLRGKQKDQQAEYLQARQQTQSAQQRVAALEGQLRQRLGQGLDDGAAWPEGTNQAAGQIKADQIRQLERRNQSLTAEIERLTRSLDGSSKRGIDQEKMVVGLLARIAELDALNAEQQEELLSLERTLVGMVGEGLADCETCPSYQTDQCSGGELCGKTVLYVGGRPNMVPHYRQLIEQCGGNFLYHDGGKEDNRQLLPKMLGSADAVLCPIDCVSHDACL